MRNEDRWLISCLLLGLTICTTPIVAKGATTKITFTELTAGTMIDLTDPVLLSEFNIWAGPGTFSGDTEGADGFIIDWRFGVVPAPTNGSRRYEVVFYTESTREIASRRPDYVVVYTFDRSSGNGYVYLPGKGDKWYATNVGTIFRGNEGHWFRASDAWQRAVERIGFVQKEIVREQR
jgi:hypothetical protein